MECLVLDAVHLEGFLFLLVLFFTFRQVVNVCNRGNRILFLQRGVADKHFKLASQIMAELH